MKKLYNKSFFVLLISLLFGFFLRFYNLNWDDGHFFHPDERNIAAAVSRISFFNQMDPQFFAYGSFPIYLYRATGELLQKNNPSVDYIHDWTNINNIGRFYSALFGSLTIILVFLLSRKIFGIKTSYIATIISAFTVGMIQTAHFGVTESILMFCVTLITILLTRVLEKPLDIKNYVLAGLIFGISLASKVSSISFIVIPFITFLILISKRDKRIRVTSFFLLFALISFLVFVVIDPYTFLDFQKFMESMNYESGVATGSLPVVYTLQFDHTVSYLFQIANLFWQMGILAIFSTAGFLLIILKAVKTRNPLFIIFISFPLIYFAYVGSWHTKFVRYMDPIIPFLIISGAFLLEELIKRQKILGKMVSVIVILGTIVWAFAFFGIYTREQTRISASKWIYQNVPEGSKILNEQWDDGLPVPLSDYPVNYSITSLAMYDQDGESKIQYLSTNLANSDYIVFNSRRLYGTLIHLNNKYPITSKYYKLLFDGKLGYQKIQEFTSYPQILGIKINDDLSEETFQVYDHPKVLIFKNENRLSSNEIAKRLR